MAPRPKTKAKQKNKESKETSENVLIATALRANMRIDPYVQVMANERNYVTSLLSRHVKSQCGSSLVVNCAIGDHSTGARIVASVVEKTTREAMNKLIHITIDGRQTTSRVVADILSQMCCRSSIDRENNDPSGEGVPMNKAQVYIAETMKSAIRRKCYYVVVLEHFECFVTDHPQSLLYVLLDSTHCSPLFVIAVTEATDAVEYLEKRVRSRLSSTNRLFVASREYCNSTETLATLLQVVLSVEGADEWNRSVEETLGNQQCHLKDKNGESERTLYDIVLDSTSAAQVMQFAELCVKCALQTANGDASKMRMSVETIQEAHAQAERNLWYVVRAATPTELCLLLAARDIVQPKQRRINTHTFTFDEVYQRFQAHLNKKCDRTISCDKDTAFMAFERLCAQKLIWPTNTRATQQRNFRPYYLQPTTWNLKDALSGIEQKLPALVQDWIKKASDE